MTVQPTAVHPFTFHTPPSSDSPSDSARTTSLRAGRAATSAGGGMLRETPVIATIGQKHYARHAYTQSQSNHLVHNDTASHNSNRNPDPYCPTKCPEKPPSRPPTSLLQRVRRSGIIIGQQRRSGLCQRCRAICVVVVVMMAEIRQCRRERARVRWMRIGVYSLHLGVSRVCRCEGGRVRRRWCFHRVCVGLLS